MARTKRKRRKVKANVPIYDEKTNTILQFRGDYEFLSNFYPCEVEYEGDIFPSVENAYGAAKTAPFRRYLFKNCSPAEAKKKGRKVPMIYGFESQKVKIMKQLLKDKFTRNTELKEKLLATGDAILVEGNTWGDTFWGVDLNSPCSKCKYGYEGKNVLGELLMEIREELKQEK